MTDFLPVALTSSMNRHRYSHEFKRQIVEESLEPNASIAAVAQVHGINANLFHKWRWRYRHGEFYAVTAPSALTAEQMVSSARLAVDNSSHLTAMSTDTKPSSYIELLFSNTRVLVHGAPDRQTLHNVIDALRL